MFQTMRNVCSFFCFLAFECYGIPRKSSECLTWVWVKISHNQDMDLFVRSPCFHLSGCKSFWSFQLFLTTTAPCGWLVFLSELGPFRTWTRQNGFPNVVSLYNHRKHGFNLLFRPLEKNKKICPAVTPFKTRKERH